MIKPIAKDFTGLIFISGPINSGKSKLAEFLIKEQESIIYIATSKPRYDDPEWELKIDAHRKRRPNNWKLIEYPPNICETINSFQPNESILIDSLGGFVLNVFIIILGALYFVLAVILSMYQIITPLKIFQLLWAPLFIPSISLFFTSVLIQALISRLSKTDN